MLALYVTLFVLALFSARFPSSPAGGHGHAVGIGDYTELAWLASSLATLGGALGAGLETDEAVRQAACTYLTSEAPRRRPADRRVVSCVARRATRGYAG